MINKFLKRRVLLSGVDTDAELFIINANITDTTQKNAIYQLVEDVKMGGLWDRMLAIYPFIGGNANAHKYNLKDARDLDSSFRINWNGSVTHGSYGVNSGLNGYGDTNLNEFDNLSLNSGHLSVYTSTDSNGLFCDIGLTPFPTGVGSSIYSRFSGNILSRINQDTGTTNSVSNSLGFTCASRINSTTLNTVRNATLFTDSSTSTGLVNYNFYVLARNKFTTADFFSNRNTSFTTIGNGITTSEMATLNTIVQTYQTTLGRSV